MMFYLIDCDEDSSVLVRRDFELIVDREPHVNEKVKFMWKGSSGKTREYSGIVLAKSESEQEIIDKEKKFVEEQTLSPKEYGKGLRTRIPKFYSTDSDVSDGGEGRKRKKRKTKEAKKLEEIATVKMIERKMQVPSDRSENGDDCAKKEKEMERLRKVIKKLRKERDEALELSRWLTDVKSIAASIKPNENDNGKAPSKDGTQHIHRPTFHCTETEDHVNMDQGPESEDHGTMDKGPEPDDHGTMDNVPEPNDHGTRDQGPESEEGQERPSDAQFKYSARDVGVTKLMDGFEVYVNQAIKGRMLSFSRTHTQLARNAMEAVYTEAALQSRCLQGRRLGSQGLDVEGLAAVLNFAEHHAQAKGMKVEDVTYVKKQLSTRLCEIRKAANCNK